MKRIAIIILFIMCGIQTMAQDPSFTQFFQKSPYVNPAYTGILNSKQIHIIAHYREQWMNVPIRFTTSLVSMDWRICQKNLGVGVIALQNIEGEGLLTSTDFSLPLAAHIRAGKRSSISAAIQTTLASRKINWDNLIFSDELDPILGNIYNSTATKPSETYQRIYPSAGLIYTYNFNNTKRSSKHDYLNIGLAGHHLRAGKNNESFYQVFENSKYPTKHTLHANYFRKIKPWKRTESGFILGKFIDYTNYYFKIENQGSLKKQNEAFTTLSAGAGFSIRQTVLLGVGYRHGFKKLKEQNGNNFTRNSMSESIIFNTVFNIKPKRMPYQLFLTYSFDWNISELGFPFSGPTHEISLNMYIGSVSCRPKRRKGRAHWWSHVFDAGRNGNVFDREICDPFPKLSDWTGY